MLAWCVSLYCFTKHSESRQWYWR